MTLIILLRFLNGLLMVILPILLGLFIFRRYHAAWRIWWIGVAAMVLAQAGHIPFNALLTALFRSDLLPAPPRTWVPLFNAVVLGLSAGLWEECFRYIAYRWMAKDARSWGQGLMLGAGHGGIEAIVLGLYVLYVLFQMVALRGVTDLATLVPTERVALLQQQITQYWSTPWYITLVGAYERVLALIFHLTASVIVLQVFRRGQMGWLGLAILWHALLDATAVLLAARHPALAEIGLTVLILASLGILYYLRRTTPDLPAEEPDTPPGARQPMEEYAPDEEIVDDLEKSRYQSL